MKKFDRRYQTIQFILIIFLIQLTAIEIFQLAYYFYSNTKMTLSPGDYFNEAERKMTELDTDGSTKKYDDAADLFLKAGAAFAKGRNFLRAGDSFRKATDCMLHAGKLDKVATFAADAGRNYVKAADGEEKSFEAFNVALQAYNDLKKNVLADKLTLEAAKLFEQNKKYEKAVHYHQLVANSDKAQSKTQDYLRERKIISTILINAGKWKDAAKNYEELFVELSKTGIEKNALDFGVRASLCLLASGDAASSRASNEKYVTYNKLWLDSDESKLIKELVMDVVAKRTENMQAKGTEYSQRHSCDMSFEKIISGITAAFPSQSSA
ncbi:hypothetical protein TRFO_05990 [Tritrichomonas foetus]|uniref:Alpha-soluble NSF attachment protein n=1 Tax=Tritrichomonas foetus TaxID=1144522 RepID=A0A1J4K6Q1_9EUKA|nr:hypothetical protein TRFO_05990 [Tritrichomonas foetus]|eukprot:OHT05390.1 hypothetical protein TRFO_05990 [Tritrichomonas foetus]